MQLVPFNTSTVSKALQAMLLREVQDAQVQRSEQIPEEPARCPWIGIYRADARYPIRTLGLGSGMRQQRLRFILLLKHADIRSGEACEEVLEDLVQRVLSALLSDTTIGGTVENLDDLEVRYSDYQKAADKRFMQTAAVYVSYIGGIQ